MALGAGTSTATAATDAGAAGAEADAPPKSSAASLAAAEQRREIADAHVAEGGSTGGGRACRDRDLRSDHRLVPERVGEQSPARRIRRLDGGGELRRLQDVGAGRRSRPASDRSRIGHCARPRTEGVRRADRRRAIQHGCALGYRRLATAPEHATSELFPSDCELGAEAAAMILSTEDS